MSVSLSPPMFLQFFVPGTNQPGVGMQLFTYIANSSTKQATWTDSTQTSQNTNPIIADANGVMIVWLDPTLVYKFVLAAKNDTDPPTSPIYSEDNIRGNLNTATLAAILTQNYLGAILYPQTSAEIAAGVTPVNFAYAPYTFLRYGLDPTGSIDSTAAINNCLAAAAQANFSQVEMFPSGALVKISGVINWPVDKVGINWRGAQLDCRGMSSTTGTYVFKPAATYSDSNSLPGLIQSHPMENFTAIGPCTPGNLSTYAGTGFINFTQVGSFPCGVTLRNGGSWNFNTHANFGNGSFFISFENWAFDDVTYASVVGKSSLYLSMPSATTAGERNIFFKCRFGASPVLNQNNGNADTHFIGCSFDPIGTATRQFTLTNGAMWWSHCHLEGSGDTDYWVSISGQNTTFGWDSLLLEIDAAKTSFALFFCDSTVINGGMSVGDTFFVGGISYPLPLVAGTGRVWQKGMLSCFGGGVAPQYVSASMNLLSDPGFANNSFARDGWTAGGTVAPTLVNTPLSPGATNVIKFTCATGNNNTAVLSRFCRPGQIATGQVYVETSAFTGSGVTLNINVNYLDANGDILHTNAWGFPGITTTIGSFTVFPAQQGGGFYTCAPAGTVSVQLAINVAAGTVTGTPIAYVGSPTLNVQ